MNVSESKKEGNEKERRFDPELLKKGLRCDLDQYEMLKRCSDKKEITEWNMWREEYEDEEILLEGANLSSAYLKGAYLQKAHLRDAVLLLDHMEDVNFMGADLRCVKLRRAHLEGAKLWWTNLKGADLCWSHLEGADLTGANLKGANCRMITINGSTLFCVCHVDRHTDFSYVGLDSARIDAGTKQLLEYNIRRKNWEKWYKEHTKLKWIVKTFWWVSDYGLSTGRIIICFFILAVLFASIFYLWGLIAPPGVLDYLFVDAEGVKVASWLVPIRAIHFSIVVMTVGFTNMHANVHSFWAHILVGFQMILGFVLLGALVTRFAILFTAGGPAGKFANDRGQKTEDRSLP